MDPDTPIQFVKSLGGSVWLGAVVVRARNLETGQWCIRIAACAFRMLWSSISAFFLSYYHLQTRPDGRAMVPDRFCRVARRFVRLCRVASSPSSQPRRRFWALWNHLKTVRYCVHLRKCYLTGDQKSWHFGYFNCLRSHGFSEVDFLVELRNLNLWIRVKCIQSNMGIWLKILKMS